MPEEEPQYLDPSEMKNNENAKGQVELIYTKDGEENSKLFLIFRKRFNNREFYIN